MPRRGYADYVVDPDRGSGATMAKEALVVDVAEHTERAEVRAGLRDLDTMTEAAGLHWTQTARERIVPASTSAPLAHPRMRRPLPAQDEIRVPVSGRQRNARSKARRQAQRQMPLVQLRAVRDLVTDDRRWHSINDALSEQVGDVQELSERDSAQVRRADRAIQAFERRNNRGHVVYANVAMPASINAHNLRGFLTNHFQPGERVAFDRYTAATHQMHETVAAAGTGTSAVFELQTRRGAYLGQSDKVDNTHHLLPRGMQFEIVDVHEATWRSPDGRTGQRMVVQLRDVTEER